jgi:hypothetical protein
MTEPRFYEMPFDGDDHFEDLVNAAEDGKLRCLVDEESGGIIAYVLDSVDLHRAAGIAEILNTTFGAD